jgi:hypothetical protein
MMIRWIALACTGLLTACANTSTLSEHPWSQSVNGLKARFQFEAGDLSNDTRITRVFLELCNVSDTMGPLYLLFDESACLRSELQDTAGRAIEMGSGLASIMSSPPYFVCIPCHATIRLDVTAYGWSTGGKDTKALIGLHDNCWYINKSDATPYLLRGTFTTRSPAEKPYERLRETMSELISTSSWDVCSIHPVWTGSLDIPLTAIEVLK